MLRCAGLGAALLLAGCATGGGSGGGSGLPALEQALAAQDSATAALGGWCAAHALADPPVIAARQIPGERRPPPREVLQLLGEPAGPVGYRHVQLSCGSSVLSVAHNWYLAERLTPEMNKALDTTDTPFGKVVAPLRFTRERLAATHGAAPGCPAGTVLSHRGLLRLPDGRPFSLVVECYQAGLLR